MRAGVDRQMEIKIQPDKRRETPLTFDDVRYFMQNIAGISRQIDYIERTPQGYNVHYNADSIGSYQNNDLLEVPASLGLPSQFENTIPLNTPIPLTQEVAA